MSDVRITAREIDVDPVRELPSGPAAYSSSHQKAEYTSAPATMRSTTSEIPPALKGPSIHIGNVGNVEIKDIKGGKKLAVLSVATSERWKRDDGSWAEKTAWHRVAIFPGQKVERIEALVQKGTRVRLVGDIRPSRYDDAKGVTRYTVEFVVGTFGDVEVLARAKPREAEAEAPPPKAKRGKAAAAADAGVAA